MRVIYMDGTFISIHAPREGGDAQGKICWDNSRDISIHAPREGGDSVQTARSW